jgi:hypothetical protein
MSCATLLGGIVLGLSAFVLFLGGLALAIKTGLIGSMAFVAGCILIRIVGIPVHEMGHVLCGILVSIPAQQVVVGRGPAIFTCRFGETLVQLRLDLLGGGGLVTRYHALVYRKYRSVFCSSGGILADVVLLGALVGTWVAFGPSANLRALLAGAIFWQLLLRMPSMIPRDVMIDGKHVGNDMRSILSTLFGPPSGPTQLGLWFADVLSKYSGGQELAVPTSAAAVRICHHLIRDRWVDEAERRDADAALMRELKRGGLTREEEVVVLDLLSTDALIFADPDLRPHLEKWSLRAFNLAPNVKTVCATRGGALVEQGRYAEAITLLEPLTSAEEPAFDRLLTHAFLARAEHALGNTEAAVRNIAHAREIWDASPQVTALISFMQRIEAEVGASDSIGDDQASTPKGT